jgi:hypothetical protein
MSTYFRYRGGRLMEFKGRNDETNFKEALPGWAKKLKAPRKPPACPYEDEEQMAFVDYLDKVRPEIKYFAIPNGGRRHPATAKRMKATGLKPGVPDMCFPIPRAKYHGLYIEMKREKGGYVDPDQVVWIDYLRGQGYKVEVAKGCQAAIDLLEAYIKLGQFKGANP